MSPPESGTNNMARLRSQGCLNPHPTRYKSSCSLKLTRLFAQNYQNICYMHCQESILILRLDEDITSYLMINSFSIRNVCCDYYLSEVNQFSSQKLGHLKGILPVLRIFGIFEETGEKCCAHIHGVFPYLLLKLTSPLDEQLEGLIRSIITNIVKRAFPSQEDPVVGVEEVEAKSVYGFTTNEERFVQIFFRNPRHLQIASLELQKQALTNPSMQPFFSHIPYVLQFFIRYDISGMDLVHFNGEEVEFRSSPKTPKNDVMRCINNSSLMSATRMSVEFDAYADAIQNPSRLLNGQFLNAGLELVYSEELARQGNEIPEGLTPEGCRELQEEHSKIETEYLNKLKDFCDESSRASPNPGPQSSQFEVFNQFNSTILDSSNIYPQLEYQETINAETTNMEAPDFWEMEMQTRGYEMEVDDEDLSGNEEIVLDEDEEEQSNHHTSNELNFNAEERTVKKSGIVRPVYGTVSSNPEDNPSENLVACKRRLNTAGFDEMPQTQTEFFCESNTEDTCPRQDTENTASILTPTSTINNLSAMAVEILALPPNKSKGVANPEVDPIMAIAVAVCDNVASGSVEFSFERVLLVSDEPIQDRRVESLKSEEDLLEEFVSIINKFDPDIIVGYDFLRGSIGYICERAIRLNNIRFMDRISRVKNAKVFNELPVFVGRIKLEVWRIVRRESPMRSYDFGSLVSNILKKPFPEIQIHDLITLNETGNSSRTTLAIHFLERAKHGILLLNGIEVFLRTSQMCRVFGIQFFDVLTRGSQFRIESMLLRVAKKFSYMPPSISIEQRNRMDSPLTIPLNLEPISGIYRDPVAVLDFQSLYPSVSIAYNYCYSTCLGKMSNICSSSSSQQSIKLGALEYCCPSRSELGELLGSIHVSPTGGVFVKKDVKLGLLPIMLRELLDMRLMIKKSMKRYKNNRKLYRMLDAQQLALKLVANVTYGYTAANWSGRMPCDVVADAIVSKGREALENAIDMINTAPQIKYRGAKVVYGDTDSCFVHFKGCTREEAFELGKRIAEDVTAANPYPMKLKFEKIMQPCVLLTKKRYVGNSYENSPDEEPKFDAKGIETVRRDSCLFVSKLMEKCLKILFERDAATTVQYLRFQLGQIDRFPFSDFVLNAEFRDGYSNSAVIPVKKLALERKQKSSRLAPVRGERLPFLIVNQEKRRGRIPLIDCVVSWEEFLSNKNLKINYNYYVRQQLFSSLGRILDLVPVKLSWHPFTTHPGCIGCNKPGPSPFCNQCTVSIAVLQRALFQQAVLQRHKCKIVRACNECIGADVNSNFDFVSCANFDCNILKKRLQIDRSTIETDIRKHRMYVESNEVIYLSD